METVQRSPGSTVWFICCTRTCGKGALVSNDVKRAEKLFSEEAPTHKSFDSSPVGTESPGKQREFLLRISPPFQNISWGLEAVPITESDV